MNYDILIFAEQRDGIVQKISHDLMGGAKRLAAPTKGRVIALLAGYFQPGRLEEEANMLTRSGADLIYTVNHPLLLEYTPAAYIEALTKVAEITAPSAILIGATTIGIDLAPEVSIRLDTGLVNDCTALILDEKSGTLLMKRPGADGRSVEIFECPEGRPAMATVRPGVLSALAANEMPPDTEKANIQALPHTLSCYRDVQLLQVQKVKTRTADITKARVLVAGGRGVGSPDGFHSLRRIADLLGGEIACSRACVEAGWINTVYQVGQTGKTVHPELYLACGISGAFQHVTGMEDSKLIIAINNNPAAPIFDIADLGIVGNVENVLPALITALEFGNLV